MSSSSHIFASKGGVIGTLVEEQGNAASRVITTDTFQLILKFYGTLTTYHRAIARKAANRRYSDTSYVSCSRFGSLLRLVANLPHQHLPSPASDTTAQCQKDLSGLSEVLALAAKRIGQT